jgi:hypothetical protein
LSTSSNSSSSWPDSTAQLLMHAPSCCMTRVLSSLYQPCIDRNASKLAQLHLTCKAANSSTCCQFRSQLPAVNNPSSSLTHQQHPQSILTICSHVLATPHIQHITQQCTKPTTPTPFLPPTTTTPLTSVSYPPPPSTYSPPHPTPHTQCVSAWLCDAGLTSAFSLSTPPTPHTHAPPPQHTSHVKSLRVSNHFPCRSTYHPPTHRSASRV